MKVSFKTETCGQALVRAMKRNEEDAARIAALTEALAEATARIAALTEALEHIAKVYATWQRARAALTPEDRG